MIASTQETRARNAEALLASGDTVAAEIIYRQIHEETLPAARLAPGLAVGACLARRRLWPEARAHFSRLCAEFPASGTALAMLGAAKIEEADFSGGRDDLDRAVALEPGAGLVFVKRAELFHRLGLLRQAEADYQHALRVALPDEATRDYCRRALMSVRSELKTVIERRLPSLPFAGRRMFGRRRDDERATLGEARRMN